jgi:hypothetical protein
MILASEIELKSPKEINALSRDSKKQYYLELLRKLLKENPDGLTATHISTELNKTSKKYRYNSETVATYLEQLVAMREAYVVPFGNSMVYKYNGRLLHTTKDCFFELGNRRYYLYEIDNPNLKERFLLIQEREINAFRMEKAIGGVMIARSKIEDFLGAIRLSLSMGEYNENKSIDG